MSGGLAYLENWKTEGQMIAMAILQQLGTAQDDVSNGLVHVEGFASSH
jgi:hypothetical protein